MTKTLRDQAQTVSSDLGFSSLQEAIRVLLNKFAKKQLTMQVTEQSEEVVHLSKRAEKRYAKAVEDIKAGRNITKTESVDALLRLLRT